MVEEYSLLLPYPEVSGSLPAKQLEILSDLYAGRFSKLTAVASYGYQLVVLEGENNLSELFKGVFTVELKHLRLLASALFSFGAAPVFAGKFNYFSFRYVDYSNKIKDSLLNAIEREKSFCFHLEQFASFCQNQSLANLLLRIAKDEMLHERLFSDRLERELGC